MAAASPRRRPATGSTGPAGASTGTSAGATTSRCATSPCKAPIPTPAQPQGLRARAGRPGGHLHLTVEQDCARLHADPDTYGDFVWIAGGSSSVAIQQHSALARGGRQGMRRSSTVRTRSWWTTTSTTSHARSSTAEPAGRASPNGCGSGISSRRRLQELPARRLEARGGPGSTTSRPRQPNTDGNGLSVAAGLWAGSGGSAHPQQRRARRDRALAYRSQRPHPSRHDSA
jgi:hypothetical protein